MTRAEACRKGFEIMRRALGPDRHLQDCGPGPVTVGLLDSMRIELDQNHGFRKQAWKQYFLESTSSAPAAAKRYYFHKRTWINDADHVCLNLLSLTQAQAAASLLALSGGNLLSGDRLPDLDPSRLEILQKVLPSYGEAARPVDLFDTDRHSIFALKIRKPFGEWPVAGLFNASETETIERTLPLGRLWLDPAKTCLAYDFWSERLHGELSGELRVTIAPASVVLLALHEKQNVPQVLSTDRPVLQGALELERASWNAEARTIEGVSLGPLGTAHHVAVYVPEAQRWVQGGPFLFHDFPGYTVKMMDDHLLRIRVRFDRATRVPWQVDLGKFLLKQGAVTHRTFSADWPAVRSEAAQPPPSHLTHSWKSRLVKRGIYQPDRMCGILADVVGRMVQQIAQLRQEDLAVRAAPLEVQQRAELQNNVAVLCETYPHFLDR